MREGLRSGKCKFENGGVPAKPVVAKKRKYVDEDDDAAGSDSGVEKGLTLVSSGCCSSKKLEGKITSVAKKKAKTEERSYSGVQTCRRVLRSNSSRPVQSVKAENRDVSEKGTSSESGETHERLIGGANKSKRKGDDDERLKQEDPDMENSEPGKKPTGMCGGLEKVQQSDDISSGPAQSVKADDRDVSEKETAVENEERHEGVVGGVNELKRKGDEDEKLKQNDAGMENVEPGKNSKGEFGGPEEVQESNGVSSGPARSVKAEDQDVSEKETSTESEKTHEGTVDEVNKSKRKRNEDEMLEEKDSGVDNGEPRKKPKGKCEGPKEVQESNDVSSWCTLSVEAEDQDVSEKETAMEIDETHDGTVNGVNEWKMKLNEDEKLRQKDPHMENDEQKKETTMESEEAHEGAVDGVNKLKRKRNIDKKLKLKQKDSDMEIGELRKKPKGKRGRPKKVQESNGVSDDTDLRVKLTRRCKTRKNKLKPWISDGRLKKKKVKDGRGRPKKVQKIDEKSTGDAKGDKVCAEKIHDKVDTENGTVPKKGERARSDLRQSVRDKIIEIVLSAGWTIQYRLRNGRAYHDSVYINLQGQTHWSVTLAYNKLKQSYEKGDGESKYYPPGFKFIPIPGDEIGVLKKVMTKTRVAKKKSSPEERESLNKQQKKKNKEKGKGKVKVKGKKTQEKSVSNREHKKMQKGKRQTLLVRKSMEEADTGEGGYTPHTGKRTVFAWMIDLGTVSPDAKVKYFDQTKTRVLLEGRLVREGIHCDCCEKILTASEFEAHAGDGVSGRLENMFLESGTSLSQYLLESWNKQPEAERSGFHHIDVLGDDPNDDTCGICGDGGDLICCDGCPSTFHQSCLDIQKFPSGDWHCAYCSCKNCGKAGRNERQDEDHYIVAARELLSCQLCEEKYHLICTEENDVGHESFCRKKCSEISKNLEKLLGVKHNLGEGFSCTFLRRSDLDSCKEFPKCDVAQKIECNSKLAVALSVMDECFLPMLDQRSGINLIRNIVYNFGSNIKRLSYNGFLAAILERGDEIISVASIRIHGFQLAEMPFIGTRYMYRRQGMCRRLLTGIESVLHSLGVERLVIPAISQLEETWTSVFGFKHLKVSEKEEIKSMNLVVFPGVQMLQKPTSTPQIAEEDMILIEGTKNSELMKHPSKEEVLSEADGACVMDLIPYISSAAIEPCGDEIHKPVIKPDALDLHIHVDSMDKTDPRFLAELGTTHDNPDGKSRTVRTLQDSICVCLDQSEDIGECRNGSSKSIGLVIELTATKPCGDEVNEPDAPSSHIRDGSVDETDTPFSAELGIAHDNPWGECEQQTVEITESTDSVAISTALVSEEEDQPSALSCSESEALDNGEIGYDDAKDMETHEIYKDTMNKPEASGSHIHEEEDQPSALLFSESEALGNGESAYDEAKDVETHEPCKDVINEPEALGLGIHNDALDRTDAPSSADLGTSCDNPDGKSVTIMNLPISLRVFQGQTEETGEYRNASSEQELSVSMRSKSEALGNGELDFSFERVSSNVDYYAHHREEKLPVSHNFFSNREDTVQTSLTLGGIYSSPTAEKPESDSRGRHLLLDDLGFGSSRGVFIESNGHCISKEIIPCSPGVIVDNPKD